MAENDIYKEMSDSQIILPEDENPFRNDLKTSTSIKLNLSGVVTALEKNRAKTRLFTTTDMVCDNDGLIHSGFIFSAANYAALASINLENCITINARINFFAPAKLGDTIDFDATAYFDESRKRDVRVFGYIKDMKVFEGTFQLVTLDEHIFVSQQKNIQKEATLRRMREKGIEA